MPDPAQTEHGKPCKRCGKTLRYMDRNHHCVACAKRRANAYYAANTEKRQGRMRDRYWNLSGLKYNQERLRLRRLKGLQRMAKRREKRGSV